MLDSRECDYVGELLVKDLPLASQQAEPTLPAQELCGSISAEALAAPPAREWIRVPACAIRPRSEWPRRHLRTKVRERPGECPDLIRGPYQPNIISLLPDAALSYGFTGAPLANGIFSMPKEDAASTNFDPLTCVLRLTLNLTPSNKVRRVISGEVRSLPLFSQWLLLELPRHECLALSSGDVVSAFNLFQLPRSWWALFVLAEPISDCLAAELGQGNRRRACVSVIPMGWLSATGLRQHVHGQLVREARALAPSGARLPGMSRTLHATPGADLRLRLWLDAHLDDHLQAECLSREESIKLEDVPSELQVALREVYVDWGVSRSDAKAETRVSLAVACGAQVLSRVGRAMPAAPEIWRLLSLSWHIAAANEASAKELRRGGGL